MRSIFSIWSGPIRSDQMIRSGQNRDQIGQAVRPSSIEFRTKLTKAWSERWIKKFDQEIWTRNANKKFDGEFRTDDIRPDHIKWSGQIRPEMRSDRKFDRLRNKKFKQEFRSKSTKTDQDLPKPTAANLSGPRPTKADHSWRKLTKAELRAHLRSHILFEFRWILITYRSKSELNFDVFRSHMDQNSDQTWSYLEQNLDQHFDSDRSRDSPEAPQGAQGVLGDDLERPRRAPGVPRERPGSVRRAPSEAIWRDRNWNKSRNQNLDRTLSKLDHKWYAFWIDFKANFVDFLIVSWSNSGI